MKRFKIVLSIISTLSMFVVSAFLTVFSSQEATLIEFNNKSYWEFIDNYVPVKYSSELLGNTVYVHKENVNLNNVLWEIESAESNKSKAYANGTIKDNLICYNNKLSASENEINSFLKENGYKATAIVTKTDSSDYINIEFDETIDCDDRMEIFNALINNYDGLKLDSYVQTYISHMFREENGDFNGDGLLNVRDCAGIANAIVQKNKLPDNADFNNDGKKNVRDVADMAKFIASNK